MKQEMRGFMERNMRTNVRIAFDLLRTFDHGDKVGLLFLLWLGEWFSSTPHLIPYLFLSFLDFLSPVVSFSQQPCGGSQRRLCRYRKTSRRSSTSIGRKGRKTRSKHASTGSKSEQAPVTGIAYPLEPFVKESWKLGFGILIPNQLDKQADEDLAVVLVVCVLLLQRSLPYEQR